MKITQKNLELKTLKCIVTFDNAIFLAQEKSLKDYHFLTKEPGSEKSLTGVLYKICTMYASESGGNKITDTVLEHALIKNKASKSLQEKMMSLWYDVVEEESSIDEFPMLIDLMKKRYCVKLMAEMVDQNAEDVAADRVQEAISTMVDYANKMNEELDDFKKDKVSFDMSQAKDFFFKEYDERAMNVELFKGINCGLSQIDSKTFGFMPSQLIVLLAPSSGGKSVQLLNWADYAHRVCKKNVLYFSFEMSSWLCKLRHASLVSEIDYSRLKAITINPEERKSVEKSFEELQNGNYFEYMEAIEDPTPEFIEQKIREITSAKGKPDLIVADYIGNMTSRTTSKNAKHWEKNGDAAEGLFKIAKRYNVPVLTAQQINRDSIRENRKRKEDGKAAAYYQDAASGDQRLMHLSTYVIGMEPNKEENTCWYYPVKMRDAWFQPFAARWIPEYNKVVELTESQQTAMNIIKTSESKNNNDNFVKPFKDYENPKVDFLDMDAYDIGI
jgi:replicative DNA helicase